MRMSHEHTCGKVKSKKFLRQGLFVPSILKKDRVRSLVIMDQWRRHAVPVASGVIVIAIDSA